mgnify:CR=1 FL=1
MEVEFKASIRLQFLFESLINIFGVNQEIEPFLRCLIQMLNHIICQLESQAGDFVHAGIFAFCLIFFVYDQNSLQQDDNRLLKMLPILWEEIEQTPESDDAIAQNRVVFQKLHHEIRDGGNCAKQSFGVCEQVAQIFELEEFWAFVIIHRYFKMGVADTAEHQIFDLTHEFYKNWQMRIVLE